MKKLILVCGLATGLYLPGHAQPTTTVQPVQKHDFKNGTPEEKAKKDADRAEKDLGLTSSQKDQWQAASLKMMNANQPYREKMNGPTTPEERMELRKQMKLNRDAFNADVNAFLTPEQKVKRDALHKERKEDRRLKMKQHDSKPNRK